MILHENKTTFEAAIQVTAAHFGIPDVMIEKDYWVTYALKQIFTHPNTKDIAVFKGGTALSKCYRLIERFSEDIDIVLITDDTMSGNVIKSKLKSITGVIPAPLTPMEKHPLENKKGNLRKVVFQYDKASTEGQLGQVRDAIVLEVSALGSPYPSESFDVYSLIARYMGYSGNLEAINQFELGPFKAKVLGLTRTFCEKIISLVRFSYTKNPIQSLSDKVRHIYDLHFLLQQPSIQDFLNSSEFEAMLSQVGIDDDKAIPNDKVWLYKHPSEALIFSNLEDTWKALNTTYNGVFKELTFGETPSSEVILNSLLQIKKHLLKIDWKIKEQ